MKSRLYRLHPLVPRYYRLSFNLLSLLLLMPIAWFLAVYQAPILWRWDGGWLYVQIFITAMVVLGFYLSSKGYDLQEFAGLRQWNQHSDPGPMALTQWHRYVRHPWYFLALVYIWSRDMDSLFLCSAILLSLYFYIGSKLEDRKLCELYGATYLSYCEQVPGIFPIPGRYLSRSQWQKMITLKQKPTE
ncbi:MAG: hypothetical protein OEZ68_05315 [Gammaproteobacteria bacterium]|nr:hypothetical protein [Gammaproteobacteria bacterium]MDH5800209.1 hypothetical protein [Gammaproteobacteria bacterium]